MSDPTSSGSIFSGTVLSGEGIECPAVRIGGHDEHGGEIVFHFDSKAHAIAWAREAIITWNAMP